MPEESVMAQKHSEKQEFCLQAEYTNAERLNVTHRRANGISSPADGNIGSYSRRSRK